MHFILFALSSKLKMFPVAFPYKVEPITEPVYKGKQSEFIFKIVEYDPWNEHPFMYFICGNSCNVLIDTGCGSGNIRDYLGKHFERQVNTKEMIVINTHNHFDHTGGNYQFALHKIKRLQPGCKDLCAGAGDQEYTLDPESNLGWAVGCTVYPWHVTRWLTDNDVISLGSDWDNFIYVLHTPGKTPDSISLYYPREQRLFIGDFMYRWSTIWAITGQADLKVYEASALKLLNFIRQRPDRDLIRLSCGHVDSDMPWFPVLEEFHELLKRVNDGSLPPKAPPPTFIGSIYETRDSALRLLVGKFAKDPPSALEAASKAESSSVKSSKKPKKKKTPKPSKEVEVKHRPYLEMCDTESLIGLSHLTYAPPVDIRPVDRLRFGQTHPHEMLLGRTMPPKPDKQLSVNPSRWYFT